MDSHARSPILNFNYPAGQTTRFSYIRRLVRLELGSLTDQQPVGRHSVRPWVADDFPALFADWHCEVIALELARSFWEKATILHAEYHRPDDQPTPSRYARHYADLARLLDHAEAGSIMADKALCARVVAWKSRVFARGWARYDLARHGEFRLVPPVHRQAALAEDYSVMRPMFLREPPTFEQMMEQLGVAERMINSL
jgi:nucleotidyltransferase AbiEii toxin of type IV toxin-antitoxin system